MYVISNFFSFLFFQNNLVCFPNISFQYFSLETRQPGRGPCMDPSPPARPPTCGVIEQQASPGRRPIGGTESSDATEGAGREGGVFHTAPVPLTTTLVVPSPPREFEAIGGTSTSTST